MGGLLTAFVIIVVALILRSVYAEIKSHRRCNSCPAKPRRIFGINDLP